MENGGKESFSCKSEHQYHVSQSGEHTVMPITKRIAINMSIQVCLILRVNFDHRENVGKKAFLANPKHQYSVSQCGEHDCPTNNKKNGDYYGYQSLSHFKDELWP